LKYSHNVTSPNEIASCWNQVNAMLKSYKAKAKTVLAKGKVKIHICVGNSTRESIIDAAEAENVDLIVCGARGLTGLEK
jgi:nucleotide-binding universal stress UspA family protein